MATSLKSPVLIEFEEVVEQARNLIEAHEKRAANRTNLTLNEMQELAVLWIRLDDLNEVMGSAA